MKNVIIRRPASDVEPSAYIYISIRVRYLLQKNMEIRIIIISCLLFTFGSEKDFFKISSPNSLALSTSHNRSFANSDYYDGYYHHSIVISSLQKLSLAKFNLQEQTSPSSTVVYKETKIATHTHARLFTVRRYIVYRW